MKSIKDIKQFYDESTFRKLHGFIYSNDRIEYAWQSLIKVFELSTTKRVLEIGCGIGEISFRLATNFKKIEFVGFDISEKSVSIANTLFPSSNLSFVRADTITQIAFENKDKFDIIFMMDVFEHIPVEQRDGLLNFIKNNITANGFVFLSCPTPQHLQYLNKNQPSEIQPVDEDISLDVLMSFSAHTGMRLISYREISVWKGGDYFHTIFSNYLNMQPFTDFKMNKFLQPIGLKKELQKKINQTIKLKDTKSLVDEKKQMIKSRLGEEILFKVETFGK